MDAREYRAKPVSERAKLLSGHCEAPQGAKPVRFDLRRGPRVGGVLRSRAKLLSGHCEAPQGAKPVRFDLRRGPRVGGALRS